MLYIQRTVDINACFIYAFMDYDLTRIEALGRLVVPDIYIEALRLMAPDTKPSRLWDSWRQMLNHRDFEATYRARLGCNAYVEFLSYEEQRINLNFIYLQKTNAK